MNLSGAKDPSERGIDPSPFTDVPNRSHFTIQPSSSHTNQECPPTVVQMSSPLNKDEQSKFLSPQPGDLHNFCESVTSRQDQHPNYRHPCGYGTTTRNDHLWHAPLINDDVVRLSSLLSQSLLSSAFPAHLLLAGRSYLEAGPASARNTLLLSQHVPSKERAFSSDGSSLSLDGYHKSKCFKDSAGEVKDDVFDDDSDKPTEEERRIDVCNVKELPGGENISPSTHIDDRETPVYEENSDDDSNSLTSLSHLEGQCARTIPGLLKYYSRHKWSLSSSLEVSLAVTGQSTPPSSPISPGTFQRPIVSSAQLNERLITVNSSEESKSKSKNAEACLTSVVPLLTVPKSPSISGSVAPSSNLENTQSRGNVPEVTTISKINVYKSGKCNYIKANLQPSNELSKPEMKLLKICENKSNSSMLKERNNVSDITPIDPMYRTGMPIRMENLSTHMQLGTSSFSNEDLSRYNALLLSQGIDPNMAARIGLGYQFVRDPVTGHIILLPNTNHLPGTNPSLLWTGYGGVAASPLVMAPQQLLLNDSHYRHGMHPHLLHLPQQSVDINKTENSGLKYNHQNTNHHSELPLPMMPSNLPSATIPPHILYPSTTLPCYLTTPAPSLYPMSNLNTQLSSNTSENTCTETIKNSITPAVVTTTDENNSSTLVPNKINFKVLTDPKNNNVPLPNLDMEPPMDLTKKKIKDSSIQQELHVSVDTELFTIKPDSVKKEIKQEILSPNQISNEGQKNSFDVRLKEEYLSDSSESISSSFNTRNSSYESLDSSEKSTATNQYSHMQISPQRALYTEDETPLSINDSIEKMDISGLNLLSRSIQQHEDNHQSLQTISDEEMNCMEMPKLEKIHSPSPRQSPASCELPPVLTPVSIDESHNSFDDCKPIINSPNIPTQYSGLNILCVLAEQELNEKNNNCSALSSLAEVAAAHDSIKECEELSDISASPLPALKLSDHQLVTEYIEPKMESLSDTEPQIDYPQSEIWKSSIDINSNYKETWRKNENNNLISDHPKYRASLVTDNMNGREIKVRFQLAELQRKYKKKREKLTKLHKKKYSLKKTYKSKKCNFLSEDNLDDHYIKSEKHSPDNSLYNSEKDTSAESHIHVNGVSKVDVISVQSSLEASISDSDQYTVSSKRKPGRPKKLSLKHDELYNSNQNYDFMMVSHKHKILPKLKAELKIKDIDRMEENSNYSSASRNDDLSDDNLPLSVIQQKYAENFMKCTPVKKIKLYRHHGKSSLSRHSILKDKEKRKKSIAKQSNMEELFRSLKRHSKMAAEGHDESEEEKYFYNPDKSPLSEEAFDGFPTKMEIADNNADIDSDNLTESSFPPLSKLFSLNDQDIEEAMMNNSSHESKTTANANLDIDKESNVCELTPEDLIDNASLLVPLEGLFYIGSLQPIAPPDVYTINIDGERPTNRDVYCQEDLIKKMAKEIKPGSTRFLKEGTRVCAFWSPKYRELYSGIIAAASTPSPEDNPNLVNVEFDDGDVGRIHIDDIRLLPKKFYDYKPEPSSFVLCGKRKRLPTIETDDNSYANCSQADYQTKKMPLKILIHTKQNSSTSFYRHDHYSDDNQEIGKRKHKRRKHRHKHKHKTSPSGPFPRVEPGDGELRVRITSPSSINYDNDKHFFKKEKENESDEDYKEESEESEDDSDQEQKVKKNRSVDKSSKIAPFLPEQQLWEWSGKGVKRGRKKKTYYKEIRRGKEQIKVGDCAFFLSTGTPDKPFIGKIEHFFESTRAKREVKMTWFYHPGETNGMAKKLEHKGALFHSDHIDKNDIQTISHLCNVVPFEKFYQMKQQCVDNDEDFEDVYYLAGFYSPTKKSITMEPGVS